MPSIFSGGSVDPIGLIFGAAFFSYLYGIIPAIGSGLLAGLLVQKLRPSIFVIMSGLIGATTSFTFMATWKLYQPIFSYHYFWMAIERMAIPGFVGGAAAGVIVLIGFYQLRPAYEDHFSNQSAGV